MPGQQFATSEYVAKRSLFSVYVTDTTAQAGTGIDTTGYQTWCALVTFGDTTASASETVEVYIETCTDSSGTSNALITGATTGEVAVGASLDNDQYVIWGSCKTLANKFIRGVMQLSAATTKMQCSIVFILGGGPVSTAPATAYVAEVGPV